MQVHVYLLYKLFICYLFLVIVKTKGHDQVHVRKGHVLDHVIVTKGHVRGHTTNTKGRDQDLTNVDQDHAIITRGHARGQRNVIGDLVQGHVTVTEGHARGQRKDQNVKGHVIERGVTVHVANN